MHVFLWKNMGHWKSKYFPSLSALHARPQGDDKHDYCYDALCFQVGQVL